MAYMRNILHLECIGWDWQLFCAQRKGEEAGQNGETQIKVQGCREGQCELDNMDCIYFIVYLYTRMKKRKEIWKENYK